jgi:hypothetical protein
MAAFTAVFENGKLFSWGNPIWGGANPEARAALGLKSGKLISLTSTGAAFIALFEDGTLFGWGWSEVCNEDSASIEKHTDGTLLPNPFPSKKPISLGSAYY